MKCTLAWVFRLVLAVLDAVRSCWCSQAPFKASTLSPADNVCSSSKLY